MGHKTLLDAMSPKGCENGELGRFRTMNLLFSTDHESPNQSFKRWKDFLAAAIGPADHYISTGVSFKAKIEAANISHLNFIRMSNSGSKSTISADNVRNGSHADSVFINFQLEGNSFLGQDDRISKRKAGEFTVLDNRPGFSGSEASNETLVLVLPRYDLERMLGSTRNYSALTIGQSVASAFMAATFIQNLVTVADRLTPDAADRMARIGVELIVASIAEQLGQEVPRSLHSTVIIQRAKTYIEDNLGDQNLSPSLLAAFVGVSLRRLQQLFQDQGRSISDWIWQRRLEVVTNRLVDPGYAHHSIGELAYACGFVNQAHFNRRFKAHHGLSPREYRWRALIRS